jgi:hypoxia up-regulated 1
MQIILSLALLCAASFFFGGTHAQKKAILGIDVGDTFMKVAVIQHGRFPDIVTNTASKRKTETAVGFDNFGYRLFAGDAANAKTRTPLQVYSHMPSLLGVSASHPVAITAQETFLSAHNVSVDQDRGTILFTHPKPSKDGSLLQLSVEDLTAMLLGYAKAIGEEFAAEGSETRPIITDCVLTVPSFYTQTQRVALLDAADIAGLKVLSLVDANTAAAVQYGLDRKEDKSVLIFNMGAENTQVSLVSFSTRPQDGRNITTFKVQAKAWENTVGGAFLSSKVRDVFAKEYNAQRQKKDANYNAFSRPRAMARLAKAADKTKQVLSANKASPPVFVSSVDNDIDYKGERWERSRLEELAGNMFDQALLPIDRVLKDAGNLSLGDVDAVEIIGGGLRVPKMQHFLRQRFKTDDGNGPEIGVHLNGDEAVALGAVFVAANQSRSFRVRQIDMMDVLPFQIQVELQDIITNPVDVNVDESDGTKEANEGAKNEDGNVEIWSKKRTLAKAHQPFKTKTVSFVHTQDIQLSLRYVNDENAGSRIPEGTHDLIASYSVTGVSDAATNERYQDLDDPKVKLTFELDRYGLIKLSKAHAEFQETIIEQVEEKVPVNTTDNNETDDEEAAEATQAEAKSEDDTSDTSDDEDEANDETDASDDKNSNSDEEDTSEEGGDTKKSKKKKKKRKQEYTTILVDREKTIKHKVSLSVTTKYLEDSPIRNMDAEQLQTSKALFQRLDKEEKAARELENSRNELETYCYTTRDILSETKGIDDVLAEDDKDELRESIMDTLDWLEDDDTGLQANIHQVRGKKTGIKDQMETILSRLSELTLRPKAVKTARAVLVATEAKIEEWRATREQITEQDFMDLQTKLDTVLLWLNDSENNQSQLSNFETPAFHSMEVSKKIKSVQTFVERLLKKPPPVPVTVPLDENDFDTTASDNKDTNTTSEETEDEAEDKDESTESNNDVPIDEGDEVPHKEDL